MSSVVIGPTGFDGGVGVGLGDVGLGLDGLGLGVLGGVGVLGLLFVTAALSRR